MVREITHPAGLMARPQAFGGMMPGKRIRCRIVRDLIPVMAAAGKPGQMGS